MWAVPPPPGGVQRTAGGAGRNFYKRGALGFCSWWASSGCSQAHYLEATTVYLCETSTLAQKRSQSESCPWRYKCGLSAPCPPKHLAFRWCLELQTSLAPNSARRIRLVVTISSSCQCSSEAFNEPSFDPGRELRHVGCRLSRTDFGHPWSRRLFEELGSTAAKELAIRDGWEFVGTKGIENQSHFEQRMKNGKSSNKYQGWPKSLEMDGCIPLWPPLEG
uniref:FAM3 metabolism regulating signaling molecule A n=1 Tax=Poecilia reticulata TaxID=8081 RepID=A0A3P9NEY7_POERE